MFFTNDLTCKAQLPDKHKCFTQDVGGDLERRFADALKYHNIQATRCPESENIKARWTPSNATAGNMFTCVLTSTLVVILLVKSRFLQKPNTICAVRRASCVV